MTSRLPRALAVLALAVFAAAGSCPFSGLPVPCATPEIPVSTGLTFLVGGDPTCSENGTPLCANSIGDDGDRTIPEHLVSLDPFLVDQTEVSNIQYRECVDRGACGLPLDCVPGAPFLALGARVNPAGGCRFELRQYDDLPVVAVSWDDARRYCEWRGKSLPTEAQWERAAVGPRGEGEAARKFPWGDEASFEGRAQVTPEDRCDGFLKDRPAPVRDEARRAGRSVEGVYDLAGNVREWTLDDFDPALYCRDTTPSAEERAAHGGADCGGAEHRECPRTDQAPLPPAVVANPVYGGSAARKVVRGGAFCSTNVSQVQHDCDLHARSRAGLQRDFQTADLPSVPLLTARLAGLYNDAQLTGFRCVRNGLVPDPALSYCPLLP
ncbi:MAG: SUMF1/EgtB/PvdO family nonheme iron enzyme [Deltaproteobacteria bacterium]|nr:SUMF1/EgtB/PvdO family nonheme iron enzyme [Deltaproteobacteria bacterium]